MDPLSCPHCGGQMRVVALIQDPKGIDMIFKHRRAKGRDARAGRAAGWRRWRLRGGWGGADEGGG